MPGTVQINHCKQLMPPGGSVEGVGGGMNRDTDASVGMESVEISLGEGPSKLYLLE